MSSIAMLGTKNILETLSSVFRWLLKAERTGTLAVLNGFLKGLGYLK